MKEGVELEEQRSKRNVWLWVSGVAVVVLLALAVAAVRPWSGHGGQTIAGGKKGNVQQQEAGGNQKGSSLPQSVVGAWEPIPQGVLPSNPAPYSSRFTIVSTGQDGKVGSIGIRVLKVRYAGLLFPGEMPPGGETYGAKPFGSQPSDLPLVAVDVNMWNNGNKPIELWPTGLRFGFVEVLGDGSLKAAGVVTNDISRQMYAEHEISAVLTNMLSVYRSVPAPAVFYRDAPRELGPGQNASFTLLLEPQTFLPPEKLAVTTLKEYGFADGKKQYAITLSPDASYAASTGNEHNAHAWLAMGIGDLRFVWDTSLRAYEMPGYAPDIMAADDRFAQVAEREGRKFGVDISKVWGWLPGMALVSRQDAGNFGYSGAVADFVFETAIEHSLPGNDIDTYYADGAKAAQLPPTLPMRFDETAGIPITDTGKEISLKNLARITMNAAQFTGDKLYVVMHIEPTRKDMYKTKDGKRFEKPGAVQIWPSNLLYVADGGAVIALPEDPMAMLGTFGVSPEAKQLGLGPATSTFVSGKPGDVLVAFDIPRSVWGTGETVTKEKLGMGYIMLVGRHGNVYAAWRLNAMTVAGPLFMPVAGAGN